MKEKKITIIWTHKSLGNYTPLYMLRVHEPKIEECKERIYIVLVCGHECSHDMNIHFEYRLFNLSSLLGKAKRKSVTTRVPSKSIGIGSESFQSLPLNEMTWINYGSERSTIL